VEAERRQVTVLFTDMVGFYDFLGMVRRGSGLYADAKPIKADG
jgi:class 3 adenylate cyclase